MNEMKTSKKYVLVNNNFKIPNYEYLNVENQYYYFDEQGYIYLEE